MAKRANAKTVEVKSRSCGLTCRIRRKQPGLSKRLPPRVKRLPHRREPIDSPQFRSTAA